MSTHLHACYSAFSGLASMDSGMLPAAEPLADCMDRMESNGACTLYVDMDHLLLLVSDTLCL